MALSPCCWTVQVWGVLVLGITVIASFGVMWAPWLTSVESLLQVSVPPPPLLA